MIDAGMYYGEKWDGRPMVGGYGVKAEVPMSQGWAMYRRFNGTAVQHVIQTPEGEHWLATSGFRIYGKVMELSVDGWSGTFGELALQCGAHRTTVARTIQKLVSWGVVGGLTVRGKMGGIVLFARSAGDGLDRFAREAKERMKQARVRAISRLISKCASIDVRLGGYVASYYSRYLVRMDAHLDFEHNDHELLAKLGGDEGRPKQRLICPLHGSRDRNLSWAWGRNGRLLLKCWSHQCTYDEIRRAVG